MTRPIVSPKTSAAKAEGRLPKNFGIGRLCSASVIPCYIYNLAFTVADFQPILTQKSSAWKPNSVTFAQFVYFLREVCLLFNFEQQEKKPKYFTPEFLQYVPGIYNFDKTVTHVFMWQGYLVFSTEQSALAYLLEGAIKKLLETQNLGNNR